MLIKKKSFTFKLIVHKDFSQILYRVIIIEEFYLFSTTSQLIVDINHKKLNDMEIILIRNISKVIGGQRNITRWPTVRQKLAKDLFLFIRKCKWQKFISLPIIEYL